MFRHIIVAGSVVAIAMALVGSVRAAEETHEGKVVLVSASEIAVLDDKDGDTDKFFVSESTKITRNGKPAKLSDIQTGDRAKVVAIQADGKLVAKSIEARTPE